MKINWKHMVGNNPSLYTIIDFDKLRAASASSFFSKKNGDKFAKRN